MFFKASKTVLQSFRQWSSINPGTGLCNHFFYVARCNSGQANSLSEQLRARIDVRGPLTLADYMRAVLTSPAGGYYMHRDVFGQHGDFITSPEITQLFGEMVGLWFINEMHKFCDQTQTVQLVELGPGRGSLTMDVHKVFKKFHAKGDLSIHLVEVSPELSQIQAKRLCVEGSVKGTNILNSANISKHKEKVLAQDRNYVVEKDVSRGAVEERESTNATMSVVTVRRPAGLKKRASERYYQRGVMEDGTPVYWYYSLLDVPHQFSCFLAHEFFDALPIHKFKKTQEGWREVLVTTDPEKGPEHFKFIISRSGTPSSKIYMKPWDEREEVELCPEGGLVAQQIATRLEENGGIALIVDYGHEGELTDTFRAFRQHKQVHPLISPGSADLTADVDFSYLRNNVSDKTVTFGPVSQSHFLHNMGIGLRLKMLLECCTEEQRSVLQSGFDMIMDSMGDRYKFFSLFPRALEEHLKKFPVTGFEKKQN